MGFSSFLDRTFSRDNDPNWTRQGQRTLESAKMETELERSKKPKRIISRNGRSVKRKSSAVQVRRSRSKASLHSSHKTTRRTALSNPNYYTLETVTENDSSPESLTSLSDASIESLAFSKPRNILLKSSPEGLTEAVLKLRKEVIELREKNYNSYNENLLTESSFPTEQKLRLVEEALQAKTLELAQSEKSRKDAVKALSLVTTTDPSSVDDEFLAGKVKSLRYNVRRWVRNQKWKFLTTGAADRRENKITPKIFELMDDSCPMYRKCLASETGVRSLVEAHIWQDLVAFVFGKNIWARGTENLVVNHTAWKSYPLQTIHDEDIKHAWRVATARLMAARKSKSVDQAIETAKHNLAKELIGEFQPIAENRVNLPSFEVLISDAVQLDLIIQQQRPHYHFFPIWRDNTWELFFSPETMEIDGDDGKIPVENYDGSPVRLVLQPDFQKSGNAAGKNYRSGATILKMVVELDTR